MIITLSTIPPRFSSIAKTLHSLLDQAHRSDRVILYIPQSYRRFPDWDGCLPTVPQGVEIRRTDSDLGPATKVLPAVCDFRGQDVDILFCDDDVLYDRNWTARFAGLRRSMPRVCLAEAGEHIADLISGTRTQERMPRADTAPRDLFFRISSMLRHRQSRAGKHTSSGYCDIFLGVNGVMVRPDFFDDRVFDIPEILWTVDDYWLSGHLELNNIPIWLNADAPRRRERENRREAPLLQMVHAGHDRASANQACVDYYRNTFNIWKTA